MNDTPRMDIVYTPNSYFGVLFAERETAEFYGQIARAVRDSTTWGEFREAAPEDFYDEVISEWDEVPEDDEPFPGDGFEYGNGDGYYIGGWPTEDELRWFPDDLIAKYNGNADYTGPNYDQLYFPEDVDADAIAEELRARGHKVEKTETGDLADWIDVVGAY